MKRNMKVVMQILESAEGAETASLPLSSLPLQEYDHETIKGHLRLLNDRGLVLCDQLNEIALTWEGHEFLADQRHFVEFNDRLRARPSNLLTK